MVSSDKISLAKGVSLPQGRYPVTAEYVVSHMRGRPVEQAGRVMLHLTRQNLLDYGVDLSGSTMLGIDINVSGNVARKEATLE
ncbi:hypothetical protein HJB51_04420 [Rhizobium lentis]|uniref:Uncharacterized protein n=1 Tax=Rhizobium lentis TaxID=1138194 RepID=A0A9Q3QZB2_9HYPH|nr:hypothetical protein [Rhizobium lentis]MBX5000427.1 hypothetical protein [Rhizobium lentis]MBX5011597.1 hypothetical protein [Rhizobium lentis]MBX5018787.1 hypothetical protein [Rhizobium lentis]MBX5024785.1 hypothetical protein [Rhizobium lentis]